MESSHSSTVPTKPFSTAISTRRPHLHQPRRRTAGRSRRCCPDRLEGPGVHLEAELSVMQDRVEVSPVLGGVPPEHDPRHGSSSHLRRAAGQQHRPPSFDDGWLFDSSIPPGVRVHDLLGDAPFHQITSGPDMVAIHTRVARVIRSAGSRNRGELVTGTSRVASIHGTGLRPRSPGRALRWPHP